MPVNEILPIFKMAVGREDLNDTTAIWFVDQGSRILDRFAAFPHNKRRWMQEIEAGDYHLTCPSTIRVITDGFIRRGKNSTILGASSANARVPMQKVEESAINARFTDLSDSSSRGRPLFWSYAHRSLVVPDGGADELDWPADLADVAADSAVSDHVSITLAPAADQDYTVEFFCQAYSSKLAALTDQNQWTENYQQALNLAAQCAWYQTFRNMSTAEELRMAAFVHLEGYHNDMVEDEQTGLPPGVEG